jgi:hypothetical protein
MDHPAIETLLTALDSAPTGPSCFFRSQAEKDRYETFVTFAVRKRAAALYHFQRVLQLLEEEREYHKRIMDQPEFPFLDHPGVISCEFSGTYQRTALEFGHELCACLAALKAGLDFLACLMRYHLQGMQTDSISPVIKLAKKQNSSSVCKVVAKWMDWLEALREYRDHMVHRLVVVTETGHVFRSNRTSTAASEVPVIVPEMTPRFALDTRRLRALESSDEVREGLIVKRGRTSIRRGNCKTRISQLTLEVRPAPGYVRIEDFMGRHIARFDLFIEDLVAALAEFRREPMR